MATMEENRDRQARELYDRGQLHWPGCGQALRLVDIYEGECPHCGRPLWGLGLGPDVTPERAKAMLLELLERRQALGLDVV